MSIRAACGLTILFSGCGKAVITLDDVILEKRGAAVIHAHVEREAIPGIRKNISGIVVEFVWEGTIVGQARTDEHGTAEYTHATGLTIHPTIEARCRLDGVEHRTTSDVFVWDRRRVVVVVDIDETISHTDYDDIIFDEKDYHESPPFKGSVEALRRIHEDVNILYLTARPRFLLGATRGWLDAHGFPKGPVISSPGLRSAAKAPEFKRRQLESLRSSMPSILIGIGNTEGDAKAYQANGMMAFMIRDQEKPPDSPHLRYFRNWDALFAFWETNRAVLVNPQQLQSMIQQQVEQPGRP